MLDIATSESELARSLPSGLHIILALLLVELSLFFSSGILVLLVLTHQVIHVAFGFCELHLVHSFTSVPVEESLATEHGGEVLGHTLEHLLNGCRVTGERHSHLQALRRNVAH